MPLAPVDHPGSEAIYVVLLLPTNATMPQQMGGGAKVAVDTAYPFDDVVRVRVVAKRSVRLFVRVPGWATAATVALNGANPSPAQANSYHMV